MEEESKFSIFRPAVANIGIFIFFMIVHVLGSYASVDFGATYNDLKLPPFYNFFRFEIDPIFGMVIYWLWFVLILPLLVISGILTWIFVQIGINIYAFLDRNIAFLIFVLYYYFLASVIANSMKRQN